MEIIVILYCLENNDKKKSLHMFSKDKTIQFFPQYFQSTVVESGACHNSDRQNSKQCNPEC